MERFGIEIEVDSLVVVDGKDMLGRLAFLVNRYADELLNVCACLLPNIVVGFGVNAVPVSIEPLLAVDAEEGVDAMATARGRSKLEVRRSGDAAHALKGLGLGDVVDIDSDVRKESYDVGTLLSAFAVDVGLHARKLAFLAVGFVLVGKTLYDAERHIIGLTVEEADAQRTILDFGRRGEFYDLVHAHVYGLCAVDVAKERDVAGGVSNCLLAICANRVLLRSSGGLHCGSGGCVMELLHSW